MKRILSLVTLALSLIACDNTKLQLRAPGPPTDQVAATTTTQKPDSISADTIKLDSVDSR